MRISNNIAAAAVTIMLSMLAGCIPSAFQGPRVLKPGETSIGVNSELSLLLRHGVLDRMDVGLKAFSLPDFGHSLFFDSKYCFLERPLLLSADLGFMTFQERNPFESDYDLKGTAFHPTILLGNDHAYGGIGWSYYSLREDVATIMMPEAGIISNKESFPRVMLGVIGISPKRKWNLNLEVTYSFYSGDQLHGPVLLGFGIQYVAGRKNESDK